MSKVWVPTSPHNVLTEENFWKMANGIYADEHRMYVEKFGRISAQAASVLRELAFKTTTLNMLSYLNPAGNA